ncbi:MAG TPA: MBL fold metallo-hydrolase [Candidatus Wallbacteria bacterium]|nr:MBL fold metallo-hydrolase [Candidatus Wallbacteria bacterium]
MDEKIKIIKLSFVNAFLVKAGDGFILIDTGLPDQFAKLEEELKAAGCLPDKLKLVIITHGDYDHIGNCAKLQQKYNVKIAICEADSFMTEKLVMLKRKVRKLVIMLFLFIEGIKRFFRRQPLAFDKFKPDIFLTDGQDLRQYGLDAKIIHTPGHTKGSVCILTADGDLFAGDTLVNMMKPAIALFIENSDELKSSLTKLKKMQIKTIYPGHGEPFPRGDIFNIR